MLIATAAGLQLDLATTGDVKRTTAAAEAFAAELDALGGRCRSCSSAAGRS